MKEKQVSFRIPEKLHQTVKIKAAKEKTTITNIIIADLEKYAGKP